MDPERARRLREELEEAGRRRGDPWRPGPLGDAPVEVAETVDPERLARDLPAVFGRAWLPLVRRAELEGAGAWRRVDVGRWRLLVTVDEAGAAHVHHNVCPHRGSLLVEGACGRSAALRCPYHGLVWRPDGRLAHAPPELGFGPALDPATTTLRAVRSACWGGWVWGCLDDATPALEAWLGEDVLDELDGWPLADAELKHRDVRDVGFGWRLGVEGFLEPLHLPLVHPRSVHPFLDFRRGTMGWYGDHSRMVSPWRVPDLYEPEGVLGRVAAEAGVHVFPGLCDVQRRAGFTWLVFPMLTLNLLPNHFTVVTQWPLGPHRTRVVHELYGLPAPGEAAAAWYEGLVDGYRALLDEDVRNLERVQEGLASGALRTSPLSWYERRIRHFHARLRAWHAGAP